MNTGSFKQCLECMLIKKSMMFESKQIKVYILSLTINSYLTLYKLSQLSELQFSPELGTVIMVFLAFL